MSNSDQEISENKFIVGDRVKFSSTFDPECRGTVTGTTIHSYGGYLLYIVKWDTGLEENVCEDWLCKESV